MKENVLKIEIPNGKIVDWDESKKQNKIVLKDKQLAYNDIIKNAKIGSISGMHYFSDNQMSCLLAKNQLANVAKYLNGKWKPKSGDIVTGLVLEEEYNILFPTYGWCISQCLLPQFVFKSQELAKQAIEILGEKTVKLALEPLGV